MCEEYESFHDRSGRDDMVMGQLVVFSAMKTEVSLNCDDPTIQVFFFSTIWRTN